MPLFFTAFRTTLPIVQRLYHPSPFHNSRNNLRSIQHPPSIVTGQYDMGNTYSNLNSQDKPTYYDLLTRPSPRIEASPEDLFPGGPSWYHERLISGPWWINGGLVAQPTCTPAFRTYLEINDKMVLLDGPLLLPARPPPSGPLLAGPPLASFYVPPMPPAIPPQQMMIANQNQWATNQGLFPGMRYFPPVIGNYPYATGGIPIPSTTSMGPSGMLPYNMNGLQLGSSGIPTYELRSGPMRLDATLVDQEAR